ncbi:aminotransferase class I/II-fold pyridoxal phosphate-dependent enzyme, partial [Adlercreutzia equolifaciens]|uniref:aminotransferase class I/II-fold pyridoxal phosphate-dependent enzyme n=1 Tax=Adlercreutzia equolifaciens TaxID=446660 RepID=UPI0023AEAA93
NINASTRTHDGLHAWQYPDEELEKLADPSNKLLCLVNPSNPPSYAMDEHSRQKLVDIVTKRNPNLLIITDDVYGTIVPHYRSVFADLPRNTACVYSFSKYFGA